MGREIVIWLGSKAEVCHCEEPPKGWRRGNLQYCTMICSAPINIVYPTYSMLKYASANQTAQQEIATALRASQ